MLVRFYHKKAAYFSFQQLLTANYNSFKIKSY